MLTIYRTKGCFGTTCFHRTYFDITNITAVMALSKCAMLFLSSLELVYRLKRLLQNFAVKT